MVYSARANPWEVTQSTSSKTKMLKEPWRSLWPYRDQGVIPLAFAGLASPDVDA